MFWVEFLLMTIFNLSVCILLPRLITLDWGKLAQQWLKKEKTVNQKSSQLFLENSR